MVFKLVRIDAEEPNKIQLPIGTHLIGRGKFLECDDKRISRNHGHLIIADDSVTIEALHQNPCFFTKKGSEEKQVLKRSFKETLNNGDRFGLLPGSYWFEVLQCTVETDSQATDVSNTQDLGNVEENSSNQENGLEDKTVNGQDSNASNAELEDQEESFVNFDLNETVENVERAESPSLLDQENEPPDSANLSLDSVPPTQDPATIDKPEATDNPATTDKPEPIHTPDPPETNETETNQVSSQTTEETKSPKRSHSPEEPDGVKKIKTEPVDVKEELPVKQEPDDGEAGPSGQGDANSSASAPPTAADKSPPSPPPAPLPRERCIYGASCYRRNPVHKAQFSHPRDSDWGVGDRAPCPWGAGCRKRDPRHLLVHDHPQRVRPEIPAPRRKATKRRRSSGSESPDYTSSPEALVLDTKRTRKPLTKLDADSEEEDPYASDGSDEWVPPSDYTETPDY